MATMESFRMFDSPHEDGNACPWTHAFSSTDSLLNAIKAEYIVSIADVMGRIVEVNDKFCAISQYSRQELLGADHRIVNSRLHEPEFFADMWRRIRSGKSWRGEIRNRAKDGSFYWVDSVIAPLLGPDGRIARFVSIRNDISHIKHHEKELQDNQERMRRLYKRTPAMLHSIDMEGRLLTVSNQWLSKLGYERAEVIGRPSSDFMTPQSRAQAEEHELPAFFRHGYIENAEYQMVHKDGHVIDVLLSGILERDDEGQPSYSLAAIIDITAKKQAERQLAESEARYRLVVEDQSEMVSLASLDGELTFVNHAYARHFGCEPHEIIGTSLFDCIPEAERDAFRNQVRGVLQSGGVAQAENRMLAADGTLKWISWINRVITDEQGAVTGIHSVGRDITARKEVERELAKQHELMRVTLKSIGDAVITTDAGGDVVWLNPVAERMTGWSSAEAAGLPIDMVFHIVNAETRLPCENPVARCLAEDIPIGFAAHTVLISRRGEEFGIAESAAPIRNDEGELLGGVLVFHDVTEERRMSSEMSYRAAHDTLTGLVNRAEFEAQLQKTLDLARDNGSQHALLYIDLDQFKLVNDSCGHAIGDQLLLQVAKLLADSVRASDTLARLGGDEFAIILEHCGAERAQSIAQQICDRMDHFRFIHDEKRFRIGTSIGLVPIDRRWPTMAAVLQAADTSCYAAKEAGRNRVHAWFDTDLAMRARQGEMQWTSRIEQALDEDRFALFAQRIEAVRDPMAGIHAEVLLRMIDTDGSLIAPGAFLPAAERFHLASRIDRWVVKSTIAWMKALPSLAGIATLSVNLSGHSVGDRAFHRWMIEVLAEAGTGICARLCFEITETAVVTNIADAALFIEQMRVAGVRVALDDFGAGASSFGYLKTMPVDYLKIDGQFIRDLVTDPLDAAAVRCFVDVAKVVGMKTVAEFVEEQDVMAALNHIGVDFAQGYLMHRPAPIGELLDGALARAESR